ncbi:MAG: type I pullulanase [Eubacteriales bacterium]|nr:type I pullulanase [Eubacteriales bacterium]
MTDYKKLLTVSGKNLDGFYFDGELGSLYSKESTEFRLWSPTAHSVKLRLFSTGSDAEQGAEDLGVFPMTLDKATGVWSYKVQGDLDGTYYTYLVCHEGIGERETADIYCKACGVNGNRSMVVDLSKTNPDGFDTDKRVLLKRPTDAIIWEVQVRDFSYCASSGVPKEHRGKFMAFTHDGTTVDGIEGAASTCVDYLKSLGVNCVQINPFYDFGSVDEASDKEQYNWGYDPKNYNCPEGSFSTNPYDGVTRIRECKAMIKALHDAGLSVVMDVVYNHTYYAENSWFDISVPGYYYRYNSDGSWSNGSFCGNDTASEHKMFRKYMLDSVMYWAEEYHLDGFRFDIMGLHDVETMALIRKSLDALPDGEKILTYGEAWHMSTNAEDGTQMANQSNLHLLSERVGAFCDNIRDAIKGTEFEKYAPGFVQDGSRKNDICRGICGEVGHWAKTPAQAVNYTSCHDGRTLYDRLCLTVIGDTAPYDKRHDELVKMNKLSAAIILTSQGIPFMVAGEEMARTKLGDHNSYKSPSAINRIDWHRTTEYGDLVEYYKGLIKLRKSFSAFRDDTDNTVRNKIKFYNFSDTAIAYTIENDVKSEWGRALVIFNGSRCEQTMDLEQFSLDGWWVAVVDRDNSGVDYIGEYSRKIHIPATSALVLVPKDEFERVNK